MIPRYMKKQLLKICALLTLNTAVDAQGSQPKAAAPLKFTKLQVSAESYESVAVFDVNNDKIPDLVSGAFWYEGPAFLSVII